MWSRDENTNQKMRSRMISDWLDMVAATLGRNGKNNNEKKYPHFSVKSQVWKKELQL